MDQELKSRLTSRDLWLRALYMIFFAIAYSVAELLVTLIAVFQFIFILFSGRANALLLVFGQNLARYIGDIIRFETFNTEHKPFPFDDWPEEAPGGERWRDVTSSEPTDSTIPESGTPDPGSPGSPDTAGSDSGEDADAPTTTGTEKPQT
jgi:hypothetical protein